MLEYNRSGPLRSKANSAVTCSHPGALGADQCVVTQFDVVKEYLRKVRIAREIPNRSDRHSRQLEIDDHLRKPLVPVPWRA